MRKFSKFGGKRVSGSNGLIVTSFQPMKHLNKIGHGMANEIGISNWFRKSDINILHCTPLISSTENFHKFVFPYI